MSRSGWPHARGQLRLAEALALVGLCAYVGAVYLIVVVGGGAAFGSATRPNLGLSVVATAIVALSIAPIQRWSKRLATRVVAGDARSPYDLLQQFAGSGYSDEQLPNRMARSLAEATGARWVQVWLMLAGAPTLAASWPIDAAADPTPPTTADLTAGSAPDSGGGRRIFAFAVRHGEHLLGVLRVQMEHQPLTPLELRLSAGLAAKAGLVLRIVALRAELSRRFEQLSARTEELRVSRLRLIETQDRERRQLERDIHDGAQQQLVALAINLRLAQAVCARSPDRGFAVLAEQSRAAADAIDALSQLSQGIYPRLLEDAGLLPALRAALASSPIVVEVVGDEQDPRLPREVEAALYFCGLEALQNVAKHADATRATVALRQLDGDEIRLTISDDGRGFDPRAIGSGTGLANIRDRVDAIGGTLSIRSGPVGGTRVDIRAPAGVPGRVSTDALR